MLLFFVVLEFNSSAVVDAVLIVVLVLVHVRLLDFLLLSCLMF